MTYPDDLRCDDCGQHHQLDASIPSEIWNRIAPDGGLLCVDCIDRRAKALGLSFEVEFYWTGQAGRSRLYRFSFGDDGPLSEDWLRDVGFKWHQLERQTEKHWLLWVGETAGALSSYEDIGVEVAAGAMDGIWFCWLRGDSAGRYHRFIHVRHIETRGDLVRLVEGLTGHDWNPDNHLYGVLRTPEKAARLRAEDKRLDRQRLAAASPHEKWSPIEHDDTRGGALPEHMAGAIEAGKAK